MFRINIVEGGSSEYNAVKDEYNSTSSIDGKPICLQALGRTKRPDLIRDFLDFTFSDKTAAQDIHTAGSSLAANAKGRPLLWRYVKDNWTRVHEKLLGNGLVLERFLRMTLAKFSDYETEKDISAFFEKKDITGYDRALIIIADTVKANAKYKERDEKLVEEWLEAHGYA